MPDWEPYIKRALDLSLCTGRSSWKTIAQLSHAAKAQYQSSFSLDRSAPSSPCVKRILSELIQSGKVIGKLGARGAAYFKLREYYNGTAYDNPPMPRLDSPGDAYYRAERFNRTVHNAYCADEESLPLPFQTASGTHRREQTELVLGPLQPESVTEPVRNFCHGTRSDFSSEVIVNLGQVGERIRAGIPSDLRGRITTGDIEAIVSEARELLIRRVQENTGDRPQSLYDEYFAQKRRKREMANA